MGAGRRGVQSTGRRGPVFPDTPRRLRVVASAMEPADTVRRHVDDHRVGVAHARRAVRSEARVRPQEARREVHVWDFSTQSIEDMAAMAGHIRAALLPLNSMSPEQLRGWVESQYENYSHGPDLITQHLAGFLRVLHSACCCASPPEAVVVTCGAGKDRTGFAAAIALECLGVPRDQVLDDYERTSWAYGVRPPDMGHIRPLLVASGLDQLQPRVLTALSLAYRPAMEGALAYMDSKCGSVVDFAKKELGLTDEMLRDLREHLLE
ncbi:Tyrosine phosphatase family [Pelomyxa schiedti]|nr:Tyrosine phosphatase family [Pelomyxa schiedti]